MEALSLAEKRAENSVQLQAELEGRTSEIKVLKEEMQLVKHRGHVRPFLPFWLFNG